jgi:hypothetical protein
MVLMSGLVGPVDSGVMLQGRDGAYGTPKLLSRLRGHFGSVGRFQAVEVCQQAWKPGQTEMSWADGRLVVVRLN